MYILYFHQHFSTPAGSTATRSYQMARGLIRRGHRVTMVCGAHQGGKTGLSGPAKKGMKRGMVDGIEVIEIPLPYSNYDSFIRRAITFLKFGIKSIGVACKTDYDLLFATSTPLTAGIPGIVMKIFKPNRPFVFEVRDLWPELPREMGVITNPLILKLMSILEWLSYHAAAGCIGLAPGIVKGIESRGIPSSRVVMIPNGCDLKLFHPSWEKELNLPWINGSDNRFANRGSRSGPAVGGATQWRPEGRLYEQAQSVDQVFKAGDFSAVFTGAHGIANGLDAVLDGAGELLRKGREDIKLLFIGDGKLKPRLRDRVGKEGLTNCLFFDPVPKTELAKIISNADLGLMILANCPAFYRGTSPNKFFDYIAAGLPVLNNYPGWLAELISDNDCGLVVKPDDPAAFAEALIYLSDHPDRCREMGKKSRRLAESQFDRKGLSDQLVDFIELIRLKSD